MKVSNNTEWLFFHLWKKNPETNLPCDNLYIAETIIFRWAQPYFWYYTSKDGLIVRKTKEKILLQHIEESFMASVPKYEVMASTLTSADDANAKVQEKIEFEYIEKKEFHDYLFQREKSHNVIIQKFIEPKNNSNALIKVSWTPQFCLFFRKTNLYDLNNHKIPLINRLVTFEGAEHLSTSDSISSPILASELEQTCLNIVKHVHDVTSGNVQISKMVLYFKLDDKNRLWLLFCTGLKLREKVQSNSALSGITFKKKNERAVSPLMGVKTAQYNGGQKPKIPTQYLLEDQINPVDQNICLRCSKEELLYDTKLRLILEHDDKVLKGLRPRDLPIIEETEVEENSMSFIGLSMANPGRENIPYVMKKLYPNITEERYLKLKKNVSLMNMSFKLCESCYLIITEDFLDNEEEKKAKRITDNLKAQVRKENHGFTFTLSKDKVGEAQPAINSDKGTHRTGITPMKLPGDQQSFASEFTDLNSGLSKITPKQEAFQITEGSGSGFARKASSFSRQHHKSISAFHKADKMKKDDDEQIIKDLVAQYSDRNDRNEIKESTDHIPEQDQENIGHASSRDFYKSLKIKNPKPVMDGERSEKKRFLSLTKGRSPYSDSSSSNWLKGVMSAKAADWENTPTHSNSIMMFPTIANKEKFPSEKTVKSGSHSVKHGKSSSVLRNNRINYGSMMDTIRDLKATLGRDLSEL